MDTKKLRQKILDLAIHGKLVPQDPNDEPASVLLERIRAEKEKLIKEGKIKAPKKSKSAGDTSHYPKEVPFEVPRGWVWCRLEDFVYAVTDGDHLPPPQSEFGIPFLVISDVNTGVINFENARFVPNSYYDSLPAIRKASIHDILFTVTGSYGIVIPVETREPFCFQRHIGLIKTIDSHDWLGFVLQSRYAQTYCDKVATGTAQKTVSLGALRDLPIPIPPRKEQKRIGERLQEWLKISNHLGAASADLDRNIVLAKTKILDLAIHGKLVPQDPSEESAIELLKRMNPCFNPSHNLHYKAELPSGWQLCHIQDIAKTELGKTLDKAKNKGEEKPYLCALNVKWESFDFSTLKIIRIEENEKARYRLQPYDLLVCEGGDVGRCAIWQDDYEMYYQNALHRVRFKQGFSPDFYLYVLRYYKSAGVIDDICKGVTIKHFTGQVFNSLDLPVPPLDEQKRIVSKVKSLFEILDSITNNMDAS